MNVNKANNEENIQENQLKKVLFRCPMCHTLKNLEIPVKIILQTNRIVTVSVPSGLICEHYFQAFVDQNFHVRGYQPVDFKFYNIEYYESREEKKKDENEDLSELTSLDLFQDIIKMLRDVVDNVEIIGSAIFTKEGKVLYSSIPHNALLNTIREYELRNEKRMHSIIRMFLELKNHQKLCSEYINIQDIDFIIILVFSQDVNFAIGTMHLKDLTKQIKKLL